LKPEREAVRPVMLIESVSPGQIATFAGIWVAAAAAPGGNTAFTVSVSSRYGFGAGMIGALGFVSALFAYMMLVAYGLGFAVSQYGPVLNILRWLGVGYLLYLAFRMWTADGVARLDKTFDQFSPMRIYIQGSLICLTNPKAIVFMAFVFPQTVDASQALLPQLIVLGLTGAFLSFLVHGTYSFLGHKLGRSVPTPRARRISNRIIAVVFVAAAIGLSVSNF
jgi:homoserine/homoserine lactone efflux protein